MIHDGFPDGTVSSKNWSETGVPAFAYTFLGGPRLGYQTSSQNEKNWYTVDYKEDLDFADDLCLLSHKLQHMQEKMVAIQSASARVSLKINTGKTREMRIQVKDDNPFTHWE